ncbi:MAG: bifunctional diaminohydroxyphosphoribosylaminopyrimidine deaminase/5-amino-6-(5-phosphoribosylamino)uracil reductase RibD, partial [Longimicrobiales bacterium]
MSEAADRDRMRHALALAERGWGRVHPNPLVGALVEKDGSIVGEGWHAEYGGPHAEVVALEQAGGSAEGATLYVTLEPCNHQGKTPPCTDAILRAGIRRIVFAVEDPGPEGAGGARRLRDAGIDVVHGVEHDAARSLNAAFFHLRKESTPFIALKLALSLDAKISRAPGSPTRVSGEAASAEVHRLRAGFDA